MNVSVICACKNREEALLISLQSWMLFEEIKEIIIVDWNSDEPLNYLTEGDPRIKVIRVPNKKYFNQPQPLNLAASIATGDYILKLDADHVINPYWNFFKEYTIDENSFVSGKANYQSPEYIGENGISMVDFNHMNFQQTLDYCNAYSAYFKSLIGLLYVTRENFFKCGGFNENLGEFYGYEDSEFQSRLELLGLNHKKLNYDYQLFHIPHPDSKRIEYFEGSDDNIINQMKSNLSEIYSGEQLEHQLEYAIAQHHISKNRNKFSSPNSYYVEPKTKWHLKQINEQNYIATEMNKLDNFPPIYYVTLEENKDRQDLLERQFEKYGLVYNDIKSKTFSESDDIITGKYVHQLTGPTQGCITSHLKAIKQWYESNESDYAFFCEDDLSLKTVEHWNFTWEEFIERLPEDCECVQLMTIRGDFDGVYFRERRWDDWSETAYIMNRDYAKKLIDNYCIGDTFHLEIKDVDVMPIGENILFTNIGKVYTFPLFVENVDIPTTDVNDLELIDGQKPNHVYASEYVYNWWKKNGKNKSIDELMNIRPVEKTFQIMKQPNIKIKHNVVDCFTYFNEKELLELRINLLKNHVDKFVITDANYTFSGNPKKYSCKETIQELGLPQDMIEVIEVDLSEENLGEPTEFDKSYHPDRPSRERIQRDSIAKCLETNDFDEDTVFIVSDCDEIINPEYISMMCNHARTHRNKIFKADLVHLEGRADFRVYDKNDNEPREWRYSLFVCLKKHMENVGLNSIRADFDNPYEVVWPYTQPRTENGMFIPGERMKDLGWHFSWMGDNQNRLLKSESFSHAGQSFDFIAFNNYSDERMKEFILNYDIGNESISPSGDINCYLKPYPIEDLPSIILSLPRVKKYLLRDLMENNQMTKTELEQLLYDFSMDTENPQKNFNVALWYEREGHTAPALSYFLRAAERAEDDDFAYESLLKSHHCYDRQGTRDNTAISLLQQAMCLVPKRPEAYFLLARFHERRQQWNDAYKYASLGLALCDFDCQPLTSNVEYPGKYGLLFEKAVSGWWWGKDEESVQICKSLLNDYELSPEYKQAVISNLREMGEDITSEQLGFEIIPQTPTTFSFGDSFDWGEMTYEHIITIEREIAHENVYGFWKSVNENDVVMDIGASVGPFIYTILDKKPQKVYCVEPSVSLMKTLAKNCAEKLFDFKENPLVYINKAIISDSDGHVNIFGDTPDFETITFKNLINEYSIDKIDFLKIDCEGGEYYIFNDETIDFLLNHVGFIAMEVHLNYEGFREKFKNFRDNYLTKFNSYKVVSCTRQNISWGNNVDLSEKIFDNDFIDNYNCEFMIYINNR